MELNAERTRYRKRLESLTSLNRTAKILRFFPETDMRNSHPGLTKLAKEHGVKVDNLGSGEFVLFVNSKLTHAKLFAPGNVIAHLRMPGNSRIDPRTISLIPKFFNGSQINYDKAIKEVLYKQFKIGEELK